MLTFFIGQDNTVPILKRLQEERCAWDEVEPHANNIIHAFINNQKQWPNLKALHIGLGYSYLLNEISNHKIMALDINGARIEWKDGFYEECIVLIGENFPFLKSLTFGNSIFQLSSLAELVPKCPMLETLCIKDDLGKLVEVQTEGISAIIAQCPIRSIHLEGIVCTRSILKALLDNRRQLEETSLNIGCSIANKDEILTSELVCSFLRANKGSLRSFTALYPCDEWFDSLLEFVSNNKILKDLKVCFGQLWIDVPPISLDNLKSFVEQCAPIDSVTIQLVNFDVPHNYIDLVRSTYPNIIFDIKT